MINLLLGAPGGGKSYEAVAFHVIPAVSSGRKVITNLPLLLDAFPPEWRCLVDIRTESRGKAVQTLEQKMAGEEPVPPRPFAAVEDYGDPWRHPDTGAGPLYVIDECHLCLPRQKTRVEVAEWFSLHRHEYADVLLITQSHGKINADIKDLVQVMYRVRKAVAFGFSGSYIRKVYDGVRGDCVNTGTRKYDKKYFKYYRSHTKSSSAGQELQAQDITPIWKRWPFLGAPILLIAALVMFIRNGASPVDAMASKKTVHVARVSPSSSSSSKDSPPQSSGRRSTTEGVNPSAAAPPVVAVSDSSSANKPHPLAGFGVHIAGYVSNRAKGAFYLFAISQNGQGVFTMNQDEMKRSGYVVEYMSECAVKIHYQGVPDFYAVCDSPRIGMSPGKNVPIATTTEGKA